MVLNKIHTQIRIPWLRIYKWVENVQIHTITPNGLPPTQIEIHNNNFAYLGAR